MTKTEVARKFDEIVDFAGVEKFIDTPVKRYSSGMYVRLAFAVAAHLDPEILVVDEVLAVGDAEFQKKCLGKMGEVARGGRTVLFVSHNMGVIRSICPKTLLFDKGIIYFSGETNSAVDKYLSGEFSSIGQDGQVIWDSAEKAPGNDEIQLKKVRLLDSNENIKSVFDYFSPIIMEFTFNITKPLRGVRTGMLLNTDDGQVVLASADRTSTSKEKMPGPYTVRVRIPAEFLNQRKYIVQIQIAVPNVCYLVSENVISFTVTGGGELGTKDPGRWPGVVAPNLEWETL
jgi:lipopolysaccharide transport system ATP-binding protein